MNDDLPIVDADYTVVNHTGEAEIEIDVLTTQADAVQTRADFVQLIRALRADLMNDYESWANTRLDDFLDALAAALEDDADARTTRKPFVTWSHLAGNLLTARDEE